MVIMDIDSENVIKLIFPEGVQDDWKKNPEFYQYVAKLGSMGLEQLSREPELLSEDKAAVLSQTQDLAFANYKTFIQTAECSRDVLVKLKKSEESLESLTNGLPKLSRNCEEFAQSSADINIHRRLNSLTLTRNAQLLEILELPQLMDSCIRNCAYEEALELAAYVRRLGKKHSNVPIIANVVHEVESSWLSMLQQLLAVLRTDLPLPRVLQVVGFLRRMELFSETELRLKFLQCRDSWLQAMLAAIPKDDALQHLTRTVELSRVHLFSVITQYRAVFGDSEADMSHSSSNSNSLFYAWIMEKVLQFLASLEDDLASGIGSSLDSVVRQCMYFGLSLSRVGADFRGLLSPIFVKALQQNLEVSVLKATRKFEQDMENYTVTKTASSIMRTFGTDERNEDHPPEGLLEFKPLADFCNSILMALNDMRLCAPVALAAHATTLLQESLCSLARSLLAFYRQEQQALTQSDKEAFTRFCASLAENLIPYLQKCLHTVFPPAHIATHLGVSVPRLQKEGITYLDRGLILDPITHLLPVRVEIPTLQASQIYIPPVHTAPDATLPGVKLASLDETYTLPVTYNMNPIDLVQPSSSESLNENTSNVIDNVLKSES